MVLYVTCIEVSRSPHVPHQHLSSGQEDTAARESYYKACLRLIKGLHDVTKTIATTATLSPENAILKEIFPVLMQAVQVVTRTCAQDARLWRPCPTRHYTVALRAQFSYITPFFCNVALLINDVMTLQVTSWVKNSKGNCEVVLAGVTLSGGHLPHLSVRRLDPACHARPGAWGRSKCEDGKRLFTCSCSWLDMCWDDRSALGKDTRHRWTSSARFPLSSSLI